MAHDRIGGDTLPITHEFLSLNAGSPPGGRHRRIEPAAKTRNNFVSERQITIHDRKGMERIAGEAYGIPKAEYRRLIG